MFWTYVLGMVLPSVFCSIWPLQPSCWSMAAQSGPVLCCALLLPQPVPSHLHPHQWQLCSEFNHSLKTNTNNNIISISTTATLATYRQQQQQLTATRSQWPNAGCWKQTKLTVILHTNTYFPWQKKAVMSNFLHTPLLHTSWIREPYSACMPLLTKGTWTCLEICPFSSYNVVPYPQCPVMWHS